MIIPDPKLRFSAHQMSSLVYSGLCEWWRDFFHTEVSNCLQFKFAVHMQFGMSMMPICFSSE